MIGLLIMRQLEIIIARVLVLYSLVSWLTNHVKAGCILTSKLVWKSKVSKLSYNKKSLIN